MRIALLDSFPNLESKAELEFMARFRIASGNIGIESHIVVTSDDIAALKPDLVLSTHEFSRKLTPVPTIGLLWSPISFFSEETYRVKSVLSYDGYVVGNHDIARYLKDIQMGLGVQKPVGDTLFLPTTYRSTESAFPRSADADLCYIGVHWDSGRHDHLFKELAARRQITFYGPEDSWKSFPVSYGGPIPFDGRSVQTTIAKHGIALCLHKAEHRSENTPSMRIFEALSVGAIIICDRIPFALEHLSDVAFFVDVESDPAWLAQQIQDIVDQVNASPEMAGDRSRRGRKWFEEHWSLEHKIETGILPLYDRVLKAGHFLPSPRDDRRVGLLQMLVPQRLRNTVDVVIRTGGRPLSFLSRAVDSLLEANSSEALISVIIVDYVGRADIEAFCAERTTRSFRVRYVRSRSTGFRSTALWDGMRAATADYVAHLDDDDTVFPNHYRQLLATLERYPDANVAYSGVLRYEEEGEFTRAPNFDGPLKQVIAERRDVEFMEPFDLPRLARLDNYIQSNAWMARRPFLQSIIGNDPEMVVTEDTYLYLLMAARGPLAFTGSATAVWHWRSLSRGNSMLSVDHGTWAEAGRRVKRMLQNLHFNTALSLAQVAQVGLQDGELSQVNADSLPPLDTGTELTGGSAIAKRLALKGFHQPEAEGIWTGTTAAWIDINPSRQIKRIGGILYLRLLPACGPESDFFDIVIEGGASVRRRIFDWREQDIRLPLEPGHAEVFRVHLRVTSLLPGGIVSDDHRNLGLFVKRLAIEAPASDVQSADSDEATLGSPFPLATPPVGRKPSNISMEWDAPALHRPVTAVLNDDFAAMLGVGWSHPEPTHIWSLGPRADLWLKTTPDTRIARLIVSGNPHIKGEVQHLEVVVNGRSTIVTTLTSDGETSLPLDTTSDNWQRDATNRVTLKISPTSGCGEDKRDMGLCLWRIEAD